MIYNRNNYIRLALVLCFFFINCCSQITDEERIQSLIEKLRIAAVEREISTIKDNIAEDYLDKEGRGIDEVHALLTYYFFHTRNPAVIIRSSTVTVEDESARAELLVLIAKRVTSDSKESVPVNAAAYSFEIGFVKRSDRWWIINGDWQRLGAKNK